FTVAALAAAAAFLAAVFAFHVAAAEEEEGDVDYQERAKTETRERLAIQWQETTLPALKDSRDEKEAVKELLAALPAADKPRLVFLESTEQFGRPPKNTPQANACDTMRKIAFEAREDSPHYQVQFAAKLFACFRIDVTAVTEAQNKFFCSSRAPIVIIADPSGEICECLAGVRSATANANRVAGIMASVIAKKGVAKPEKILDRLNDLTREVTHVQGTIYLLEASQRRAQQSLRDAREGVPAIGKKPDPAAAKRAEAALRDVEKKLAQERQRKQKLEMEEYDLCQALGIK
ncbi:MAG: hypothetical protein N3A66_07370, partial [Planctomycetota bacterium]|nr:hypothetical protein [Planctomycetota bacterium]